MQHSKCLPLRWETTLEQWWYASPIEWAAANGHYELVRELLLLDNNHLIKLTSLRRLRRLETLWEDDDAGQSREIASCRAVVARELLRECESRRRNGPLSRAGYGGWLIYTAASAGDLGFVEGLLERDPLIGFGEGEYGVTDILYAAAKSKDYNVFRLVFDSVATPSFSTGKDGDLEELKGKQSPHCQTLELLPLKAVNATFKVPISSMNLPRIFGRSVLFGPGLRGHRLLEAIVSPVVQFV